MSQFPQAKKALGQHFLQSEEVIQDITQDFNEEAQAIVEIGPGPGVLTKHLSKYDRPFFLIEKDKRFPELLKEFVPIGNILCTDALEVNLEEQLNSWELNKVWLVSNLPYNISSPLLVKFLMTPSIQFMTLMFQREVADKAFAFVTRKGKAMNSLMALTQTYFKTSLLCQVPPECFSPPPKVDSAVLSFERIENPVIALDQFRRFEKFLRHLFQFKRKQMGKILKAYAPAEKVEKALNKLELTPNLRAESLDLETLQRLYLEL